MEELSTVANRHLPNTVVSPLHGAFSWCQILRGWLPPVASISALKHSRSVDPQRGWARLNALDKCEQHDQPKWLRFLPADTNDWWREDFLDLHQRPAMLSRRERYISTHQEATSSEMCKH